MSNRVFNPKFVVSATVSPDYCQLLTANDRQYHFIKTEKESFEHCVYLYNDIKAKTTPKSF